MIRLSIIIPTKNEEAHLPALLDSIRRQSFTDYEVIVADNHSSDRTVEIAKASGARVVAGGMPGPARNKGALQAKGSLLLFLDADAVLTSETYLEDMLREFDEQKADVATCILRPVSAKIIDQVFYGAYNAFAQLTERFRPHAAGTCILVRRHMHEGLKGFDEEVVLGEDMDYVQRAAKDGARFRLLKKSGPVDVSVRRFEKDGRWGVVFKYLFGELHMLVKGPIKKIPFTYEMGGPEKKKPKKTS
ncbi:MAG: hypothetical protein RL141_1048 [Candidatus Parcubacteria bacterium]|jgi:glycosyltransferase involved in cell wall biosynthesis